MLLMFSQFRMNFWQNMRDLAIFGKQRELQVNIKFKNRVYVIWEKKVHRRNKDTYGKHLKSPFRDVKD